MTKIGFILCMVASVILASCEDGRLPVLGVQENSGFSYACNMQSSGAVLQFNVYSDRNRETEVLIRCRTRFSYDADACAFEYDGHVEPITIPPDGQWNIIALPVVLKEGINVLEFKRVHPMKDDIAIDYIEIQ